MSHYFVKVDLKIIFANVNSHSDVAEKYELEDHLRGTLYL